LLSGGAGTAVARTADVSLMYDCQFPSGVQRVAVQVKAPLPTAATVGQAVSPGTPTVAVTVPQAALGDVTGLGAATVGATEKLTVNVTQSGATTATSWQSLVAAQTKLPSAGDLVLEASGVAQAVRPAAPGKVAFVAGPLTVDLTPRKADGTATSPSVISLTCAPAGGSGTTIGTVAISDGAAISPGAVQQAVPRAASADDVCPPKPTGGLNPKFPRPPIPDDPGNIQDVPSDGVRTCAALAGFSNVNKLNGATALGGIGAVSEGTRSIFDTPLDYTSIENISVADLVPKRATLLTFGFVPVSATMEITQLGNMNIVTVGPGPTNISLPTIATAQGEVSLRLTDAHVNGVPLDLGPNCRTAHPVVLSLQGSTFADTPYRVQFGGRLNGDISIPSFTGCGVGEDLDPLLTASVSGPGNSIQIDQGPLCSPDNGSVPGFPYPPIAYGFTVHPGGQWTATSNQFDMIDRQSFPNEHITCSSTGIKGNFRSGSRAVPTPLGQITALPLECSGTVPPNAQFTVTPVGLPWKIDADSYSSATDTMAGHLEGDAFHFSMQNCSFDAVDNVGTPTVGFMNFTYANSTHILSINGIQVTISDVNGCTAGFNIRPILNNQRITFTLNLSFDPPQTIIQP
jgi:hypothetical protein